MPQDWTLTATRPTDVHRTLHRRRALLAALLGCALVSLALAAFARQGSMWAVHVASDGMLLAYLAVLIHLRNAAAEHEMTRRQLGG